MFKTSSLFYALSHCMKPPFAIQAFLKPKIEKLKSIMHSAFMSIPDSISFPKFYYYHKYWCTLKLKWSIHIKHINTG